MPSNTAKTGGRKTATPNPLSATAKVEHALVGQNLINIIGPRLSAEVSIYAIVVTIGPRLSVEVSIYAIVVTMGPRLSAEVSIYAIVVIIGPRLSAEVNTHTGTTLQCDVCGKYFLMPQRARYITLFY